MAKTSEGKNYNPKVLTDKIRKSVHITKMCERLGISRTTFYYVINGTKPISERIVSGIARELNAPESEVYTIA